MKIVTSAGIDTRHAGGLAVAGDGAGGLQGLARPGWASGMSPNSGSALLVPDAAVDATIGHVLSPSSDGPAEARAAWVSRARCRSADPDELFVRGAAQRKAAVICRHCPVIEPCAADALDHRMEFGVWGGMTERQRRALVKAHPEVVSWAEFFAARRKRRNIGESA